MPSPQARMGVCTTSYLTATRPRDMMQFLDHCISLGAGGIQCAVNNFEPAHLDQIRAKAEGAGMFIELMVQMPNPADPAPFLKVVEAGKRLGAQAMRSGCLSGRRYETFNTLAEWKTFVAKSEAMMGAASDLCAKHKTYVGMENHKDWTADELLAYMKRFGNEYFGVCLDTGNNFSLLDEPYEVLEKLAPYAVTNHIKDMGLAPYGEGFLLSEVILGTGMLDLKRIVDTLRKARPKTNLVLEMITRNPLKVPVLLPKYWETFQDSRSAKRLAATLAIAQAKSGVQPLPVIDGVAVEAVKALEVQNVKACLEYSRKNLES